MKSLELKVLDDENDLRHLKRGDVVYIDGDKRDTYLVSGLMVYEGYAGDKMVFLQRADKNLIQTCSFNEKAFITFPVIRRLYYNQSFMNVARCVYKHVDKPLYKQKDQLLSKAGL
mgnify:CR=1 FL=1